MSKVSEMMRVEIKPELLSWARERAGYDTDALARRFSEACRMGTSAGLDREIDRLGYKLYELSDDEIAIIEGSAK